MFIIYIASNKHRLQKLRWTGNVIIMKKGRLPQWALNDDVRGTRHVERNRSDVAVDREPAGYTEM